ncbi:hypothetical protein [Beijerinckia indica]|uniref:Uncharacterized protein n=1 Tax=Beijerinckia indica subsp. indica (strain ATCC 9039 / DSM 1715 / NCIMB 8712) TaxID=395963 RepID=B2IF36_BEII9|nr:hypothetical protein [Beijerinckia indica]ACB95601.1 hypothetical protein Bind_1978 [Beijerinckia indica subsp. indica ATCC 9039]
MGSFRTVIAGAILASGLIVTGVAQAAPLAGLSQASASLQVEAPRLSIETVSYHHRRHWRYRHTASAGHLPAYHYYPRVVASRDFYWRPNHWSPMYHPFYW